MHLVFISVRRWFEPKAMVRSEGLCQWGVPMAPSGIEEASFRLVAQQLSHCATAVTLYKECWTQIFLLYEWSVVTDVPSDIRIGKMTWLQFWSGESQWPDCQQNTCFFPTSLRLRQLSPLLDIALSRFPMDYLSGSWTWQTGEPEGYCRDGEDRKLQHCWFSP